MQRAKRKILHTCPRFFFSILFEIVNPAASKGNRSNTMVMEKATQYINKTKSQFV